MKPNKTEHNRPPQRLYQLEQRLQPPDAPSVQEVWRILEGKIDKGARPVRKRSLMPRGNFWAVAATLLLLIGMGFALRFAGVTVTCPPGHTKRVVLPDNSIAVLNADSKLSYKRFWWPFSRELTLTGEAWFKVTKGKKFTVGSKQGRTTVLGTQFNIFARNDTYKVACLSGKVQVEAKKTKQRIVLHPAEEATVTPNGAIVYHKNIDITPVVAWKKGLFMFTGTPLPKVFEELERRYNVQIHAETDLNKSYTGSFRDTLKLQKALELVCKPFGLKFAIDTKGNVTVYSKHE